MSSEVINNVTWNIHANGTITSATGYGSNVIVPDTVDSITVIGFNNQIFKNNTTIQTISIPDTVTALPEEFFGNSNNNTLTAVTFTENSQLITINARAFHVCYSLSDFKIPSTVTTFNGSHQFQQTAMASVTIPAGLSKIDQGAFYNMPNLTELIFAPNSNLDEFANGYAFTSSSNLKVIINFPAQNFPNNSKFDSNTFHSIASNPIVIFSEETTATQGNTFMNDSNLTNRWNTTPSFYVRPLTDPNISTLLAANLTIAQLLTAGATISQLRAENITIAQLLTAGVTFQQLLEAGTSIADLIAGGATVPQLLVESQYPQHTLTSESLAALGYTYSGVGVLPGIIPNSSNTGSSWNSVTPLVLNDITINSLDDISVIGAKMVGHHLGGTTKQEPGRITKYTADPNGATLDSNWLIGIYWNNSGMRTRTAEIAFTLDGTNPAIEWIHRGVTNENYNLTQTDASMVQIYDSPFTLTGRDNTNTHCITDLVFTAAEPITMTILVEQLTINQLLDAGATVQQLLAAGVTQIEIDIALTNIKIHDAFTIRDGAQNESIFTTNDAVYTPTTFAAKLNTDLGYAVNTITAGGDLTTTDSTPYYRLYLQFANAVTLTGMPKDIFNIPFSDFSVKAGGQVNIRNVNFDAQMTITPSYSTPISFGYNTVFVTDSYFPLSTDFDGNAESNNMDNHPPFSNIINDATKYFDRPGMASAMNTDGSTMAMANGVLGVKVYDRDSNEPDGWKQVGGTIPGYLSSQWFATELYLSNNGQIIAISDLLQGTVGFAGYTVVYKRNPAVGIGWEIMGGNWDMQGDNVGATESRDYQRYASLSDDGTIVAVGTSNHLPGKVRVFNYDDVSNSWIQQGSTLTTTNGKTLRPVLSGDGTTVAIVDSINEEVAIHRRDSTTSTVWNTIGNISVTGLIDIDINKNGDIFAAVSTHIYVYKRDTNDASGWSLMGSAITPYSGGARIQIDDIGHTVTVTHHLYGGFVRGILMIYKYNTTSLVWEHAVTNNAISGTTNTVVAGGTDPILGYHPNQQYAVSGHTLTGDGTTVILSSNCYNGTGSECFIYTIPHIKVISNTSTIQAGNYCISQFVSTIKTDLVDFPLSYDASNALITFDSLAQDISMSITSTDTTIFDTSITEIPQGASTLPFITYGQPDPTLKNYSDNGITTSEFVSNGYTILQLISGSVIPDWNFDTDANRFDQSYLKGFTDVSGSVIIRNDNRLITNGDLSLGGNLITQGSVSLLIDDMTLKSRLFMGEDISANGKVYIGGDLSVNGQFSGDFANNSIPRTAIIFNPIDISGNVLSLDDISFNGPTVDVSNTLQVNQIEFNDGTTMTTHDDNILSGTFAGSNVVFKDSTFAQVTCEGGATANSTTTSDYRIKENVTELNETDTVDAVVPIQYNNTLSGNHEFGLLAHELQDIYPDLVNGEKDGDEYQRVNYNGLIGVLVKEVQDLKQRLAVLNNR